MKRRGIFVAEDGELFGKAPPKFASDKNHLIVDLERDPPHMDKVEFSGGTNWVHDDVNGPFYQVEEIFSIDHNLGYVPVFFAYFLVLSVNGDEVTEPAGTYNNGDYFYNGSSQPYDRMVAYCDSKKLYVVHSLQTKLFGFASDGSSSAGNYLWQMKYYILSIDSRLSDELATSLARDPLFRID